MQRQNLILLSLVCGLLVGCRSVSSQYEAIRSQPDSYLRSGSTPYLIMPASVISSTVGEDEAVPPVNVPRPNNLCLLPPKSMAQKLQVGELSPEVLKQKGPVGTITLDQRTQKLNLVVNRETDESPKYIRDALKAQGYKLLKVSGAPDTIIYFLDTYSTQGKLTAKTPMYAAHLIPSGETTLVYLTDSTSNNLLSNDVSLKIFTRIQAGFKGSRSSAAPTKFAPPTLLDIHNKHRLTVG